MRPERYSADIYVLFPCFVDKLKSNHSETPKSENGDILKEYLDGASEYEFGAGWEKLFNRKVVGDITLIIKHEDKEDGEAGRILGRQQAFLLYVSGANEFLGMLYIGIVNARENITFILDQCSRGEVAVDVGGKEYDLREYCKEKFGFRVGDKAYSAVCPSKPIKELDKEGRCLFANESFDPSRDFCIKSDAIDDLMARNLAYYSYYSLYLSAYCAIYEMEKYDDNYKGRLENEKDLLFIMELIVLKITAISAVNKEIMRALSPSGEDKVIKKNAWLPPFLKKKAKKENEVSVKDMLDISNKLASSLYLWDTNHFKYYIALEVANKIEEAFRVSALFEQYERNQNYLEHLVNLKDSVAEARSDHVIEILGIVLALGQIVPVLYGIALHGGGKFIDKYGDIYTSSTGLVASINELEKYSVIFTLVIAVIIVVYARVRGSKKR